MSQKGYGLAYYLLCAIAFLTMLSIMLVNPILSLFARDIGATGVWIGYAVSGYWITRVFLEIPSSYFSSRFGYFKPMVLGLLVTVAGNVLMLFVKHPLHLVLIRALNGLGAPFFFAVAMTFVVNLFDAERRGAAMGVFQGVEFVGQIIGSSGSGHLVETLGWKGGFTVCLAISLVALLLLVLPPFFRDSPHQSPSGKPIRPSDILRVLRNPNIIIIAGVTLAEFIMTTGLIMTVVPIFANDELGLSLSQIGYVMGARSLGFVVAMFTLGSLSDRVGRKPVLLFGIVCTSILVLTMNLATGFTHLAAIIAVIGFTSGAIWIIGPVVSAESVDPELRGAAIGAYRTFFDMGSFIGPITMTFIMSAKNLKTPFYVAAGLMLLSAIPATRLKETKRTGDTPIH